MLKEPTPSQSSLEFVCINDLVPEEHLIRKIDKAIDFDFIHPLVKDYYCQDNGRPPIDPTTLFKILFIGYLFGIRSERQLMREITVNVAYRWFLGFTLTEKIPDASTLSQNRRRRFNESDVYQQIFDEIVQQAIKKNLVSGKVLYTDSTHLKANANKNKHTKAMVQASTKSYMDELESAVNEDREQHGKKPLAPKEKEPKTKTIKQSTTDKDSGYMVRDNKPKGFFYLDHRTTDERFNIITDVHVTAGNVHDSIPYLERLDRQIKQFNFETEAVGLDAGYFTAAICKGIEERKLYGIIGYRRPNHRKGYFYKREYLYDESNDSYTCPAGEKLVYKTTSREGYRHYQSNPSRCKNCQHLLQCTKNKDYVKTVTRHVWEDAKERINQHRLSEKGKKLYARRKETVERSFADAKELHGYRYARYRGIEKVKGQCLLTAAAQNMKKIALLTV